ncbi:WbqC family protein [Pedobacter sp. Du54]|uniref:WbqC family protein n=1 Tax=Pedobacter anseongensis TaxID=3133439 RepID=UPI0030AF00B0
MVVAIMQPYFLPYIGYFQLISAVDKFVIYDNIQFTKKGWINRNRILVNGKDETISLPLKKDSDFLDVYERVIASSFFESEKAKLLRKIEAAYRKALMFQTVFPIVEEIFNYNNPNLFEFIHHSVVRICSYLDINTEIVISSTIPTDSSLKSQGKVLAICQQLNATKYINAIGGKELYSKEEFQDRSIVLQFLRANEIEYKQFGDNFIPFLSILDLMMFNTKKKAVEFLNDFTLE